MQNCNCKCVYNSLYSQGPSNQQGNQQGMPPRMIPNSNFNFTLDGTKLYIVTNYLQDKRHVYRCMEKCTNNFSTQHFVLYNCTPWYCNKTWYWNQMFVFNLCSLAQIFWVFLNVKNFLNICRNYKIREFDISAEKLDKVEMVKMGGFVMK